MLFRTEQYQYPFWYYLIRTYTYAYIIILTKLSMCLMLDSYVLPVYVMLNAKHL